MRFALILVLCAAALAQVNDTPRPAPDIPKDVVWLDLSQNGGAPVPHSLKDYRGKVVLIDFWEYTCINCIRDFAVVKRWYAKYHAYGFEVLGVHYGEFRIGFNPDNVKRAAQRFRLPWPVVADVKGSTWREFYSNVWPNRYLIDAKGSIVMQVGGEGNNIAMEKQIHDLLAKQHPEVKSIALDPEEATFAPQCGSPTQETYVGKWFDRGAVENPGAYRRNQPFHFVADKKPKDGGVLLDGTWRVAQEYALSAGGSAMLRYHARSVYAVLNCVDVELSSGVEQKSSPHDESGWHCNEPVRTYLFQDDKPLTRADAGRDVQFDGRGAFIDVTGPRMYDLVKNGDEQAPLKNRLPEHVLTLKPQAAGLVLHSFTYGNNCQQNF